MQIHLARLLLLSFAIPLFGCDSETGQKVSSTGSEPDAQVPNGVAGRAAPQAGTRAGTGGSGGGGGPQSSSGRDASAPSEQTDGGARDAAANANGDAATEPAADGGHADSDDDAGPAPTPDPGTTEPPTPRTDGCPEAAPLPVDRVRVLAAPGQSASLVGARLQGSNSSPTTDFVDLATIDPPPTAGAFGEYTFANARRYRYLRYYAPPGSQGGVAEVQFFFGTRRLQGKAFGTANSDPAASFERALDGDPATHFLPAADGGGYVGLDIAGDFVTQPVVFSPGAGAFESPGVVTLATATPDATIRYTTDGSDPTGDTAMTYDDPIEVSEGRTTIRALASSMCRFDSETTSATYVIGEASQPTGEGLRTYHIGNSLTDTINPWLEPIADSTGVDHEYARWTIPGAPIGWLAEHQGEGFENPAGASNFDQFVRTYAPIDHLSLQPYSDPDFDSQGGAAIQLFNTAAQASPDIQLWIYAQWPGRTEWETDAFSAGGGTVYPEWSVPNAPANWEEGVRNAALYYEAFRERIQPRVNARKPILIVPGGLALVELKRRMDAGAIPGLRDFFGTMFEDEVHLLPPAQYLVALVFYACLYQQSPEGRVTYAGTGLTEEQATIFQQIAWTIASEYPGSGIQR